MLGFKIKHFSMNFILCVCTAQSRTVPHTCTVHLCTYSTVTYSPTHVYRTSVYVERSHVQSHTRVTYTLLNSTKPTEIQIFKYSQFRYNAILRSCETLRCRKSRNTTYLLTYLLTHLLTYSLTYLLHGAQSFLSSQPVLR